MRFLQGAELSRAAPTRAPMACGMSPARRRIARGEQHGDEMLSEGLNANDRRTALAFPVAAAAPAMGGERPQMQPAGAGAATRTARPSDRDRGGGGLAAVATAHCSTCKQSTAAGLPTGRMTAQ